MISQRDAGEKLEKELKFPTSPAFVNIYKMKNDIKVPRAQDFCLEKNIPFSSEENNYFRLKQSKARFNIYQQSVNKCFETARPDDIKTGKDLMGDERRGVPPLSQVTEDFGDARLYVPDVF